MPSGGPGDEPLTDILRWGRPVYSLTIDSLIAELAELWNAPRLEEFLMERKILWMDRSEADLARAEGLLAAKRDELYRAARANGWDMPGLDARIKARREAVAAAWNQS
jgi:hypothetical protein